MKLIKYYLPGVITGVILSLVVSRIKRKQCDENSINDEEELLFYNDEEDIVHYDHVRELIMEISPLVPFALDNEQHADFIESLWTHYGQKMMIALVDYVEYCERINGDFEFADVKNNDKCMAIRHCIIDKMNFYTLTNIAFSDDDENIKNIMSPVRDYFVSIPGFNKYAPYESTIDCMQVHAEIERNVINHIDFED